MNSSRHWLAKVNNRILSDMISCFIRDICGGQRVVTGGSRILPVIFLHQIGDIVAL